MIRGVLLDVDGSLLDSNDAHAEAFVRALAECGVNVPFAKVRRCIGMGSDKLLQAAAGLSKEDPRAEAVKKRKGEIFQSEYLSRLRPTPGARDLLLHLRDIGLKRVVASSAHGDELKKLMEQAGVADLVQEETSSSEVERSKPDPDIIHAALGKIALLPAEVVLLGDTPYDVEAGRKAGVGVIGVRCGGWSDAELAGALAVYADPAELLAWLAESPLARHS
jgi:HAD superfamily hydrolase (TIGR01509 family)